MRYEIHATNIVTGAQLTGWCAGRNQREARAQAERLRGGRPWLRITSVRPASSGAQEAQA